LLAKRVPQQPICLGALRLGLDVVAAVQVDGIDSRYRQEGDNLDRTRRFGRQHREIDFAEHDYLAGCRLVATAYLLIRHFDTVNGADPLVLHPAAVADVDLM
jgi:hypothetical protein